MKDINWQEIDKQVEHHNWWHNRKAKIKLLIRYYKQLKYSRR